MPELNKAIPMAGSGRRGFPESKPYVYRGTGPFDAEPKARVQKCGTARGFWSHKSRDEDPCADCIKAHDELLEKARRRDAERRMRLRNAKET